MPEGKGYKTKGKSNPFLHKKKDKYDKPSYADMAILGGLRLVKGIKAGAKKQFKADVGYVKSKLKRKKKAPKSITTSRTKVIEKAVGDISETKQFKRMRGKKY